ncbi:unnamed protein product [Rotaria sordida]|uniref:Uncharacterized protein n=1 Tax=Rotaria sordida TaxID=392033 RepID=A0A816GP33_9BILA|nr:unnamed protein product [Rotaria sordida]CAF1675691.1 unnamed protein product [Rotaria sordida]
MNFVFVQVILLENNYVFIHDSNSTTVSELLYAAAWICSEFCSPSVILHSLKTTLKLIEKSEFNINELSVLFDGVLNPIVAKVQNSEDESITTSSSYDNKGLFYDDDGENSNSNSYSGDTLSYHKSKKYIESTAEELEKQRESKKQSEQMNPFYLKDLKKNQN